MPTLVLDPPPAWLESLLEERRRKGLDRRDEVWEGVLHVIPPPSVQHERLAHRLHVLLDPLAAAAGLIVAGTIGIGSEDDYRVPDLALLRPDYAPQWNQTAALVVEIISPRDDTWEKLPFYAARGVDEVVVVDPAQRQIRWLGLEASEYRAINSSRILSVATREFHEQLDWSAARG